MSSSNQMSGKSVKRSVDDAQAFFLPKERSIMTAELSQQRLFLAVIAFACAISVCWLTKAPYGLLAPVAALYLYASGREIVWLRAAWGAAFACAATASFYASSTSDLMFSWALFFALALCIGEIVATNASVALHSDAVQATRIVENMPAYTWSTSPDGQVAYVSSNTLSYIGESAKKVGLFHVLDNAGWRHAIHPDDYGAVIETRRHSLITGVPFDSEYRVRGCDGIYRWFWFFGSLARDEHGRVAGWYGTMIDVEEKKHAEGALRERELELSQLVDMVPGHLWRLTPDGKPIFFSKQMVDFLGLEIVDFDTPSMSRLEAFIKTVVHSDDAAEFRSALDRCFHTGESFAMRYRLRRVDGVYRWFSSRAEPMSDQYGRIIQWYGLCHDINDQMHAEEALRQSERRLQQLVDTVPAMILSATPEGRPSFVNKRFTEVTGATLEDHIAPDGTASLRIIHPDDRAICGRILAQAFGTGASCVTRHRQLRRDGSYRLSEVRMEPLRDESGEILQWYGVSVDIDDAVHAEKALQERERELSQLIDMVPIHVWRLKPDGEPTFYNKRLIDFLGLDVLDLGKSGMSRLAESIGTLIHPEDAADFEKTISYSLVTGASFSMKCRMRRADGVYRWLEFRAEPLRDAAGTIVQWYGANIDIDDTVTAQQALHGRERELSQLVDMVPSLLWRLTPDGEPLFFSKRMIEFFGLNVGDYAKPGMSGLAAAIAALTHPDDAARLDEALNRSFVTGESFSLHYRLRRADGVYRWMSGRGEPLRDESGQILQWYGLCHDIDNYVRAEEALRESERSLRQLVETLPAMIDCASPAGEPVYRSRQLREFLGYNLEDLDGESRLGGTLDAGVHPDDLAGVKEKYAYSLSTGEPYARKHRLRRFDGEYRWVETRAAPMRNVEGAILQWNVICLDIDGEVRAQERLRLAQEGLARASQAASLAELSASIAHEVNQPLAAIAANSHACHRWLTADPPNLERAKITSERIIRDAHSAAEVVSRIRALFKQSSQARQFTPLGIVVAEVRNLVDDEATRRRVRMDINVERNLPLIALDRIQIQQVLINLIRNGMEAMDSVAADKILGTRVRRHADVVQIEISDCGPGVQFADRIFEPFFTTKDQGMGMGLAICHSIVEAHGGKLWVEKNEPHGTTIIFTLPVEVKTAP